MKNTFKSNRSRTPKHALNFDCGLNDHEVHITNENLFAKC